MASARTISWGWAGIWIGPEGDAVFTGHRPKAPLAKGGCPVGAGGFPLQEVFLITESPSQRLTPLPAPFNKGAFGGGQGPSSTQAPLAKGGPTPPVRGRWPKARGGRGGREVAGGFRLQESFQIYRNPPVSGLRRCQPPLARGPLEQNRGLQVPKPPSRTESMKSRMAWQASSDLKQGALCPAPGTMWIWTRSPPATSPYRWASSWVKV